MDGLIRAIRKLSTECLETAVDAMILELDVRCGDADLEPEFFEQESDDEESLQVCKVDPYVRRSPARYKTMPHRLVSFSEDDGSGYQKSFAGRVVRDAVRSSEQRRVAHQHRSAP